MRRVLLITGASSGIGASLVHRFASEYDEIIAAARRVDRMRETYAHLANVTPVRLDVSDPDELTTFARGLVAEHGVVPYAISCAGAWNTKRLLEASNEELAYGWRVDALAHAILLRELVPAMREHDFGRFVVFSGSATLVPAGGWSIQYGAIMASNGYTVAAAIENRDRNVKINLTAPGAAATEMYPGTLPPSACHGTVEWLLNLDEHGPTGRFFWLGKEIQMFPGFTHYDPEKGEIDAEHSTPLSEVVGDRIRGREG
ncbi:MAG: SDR family oxidoreductase [Trueperaceae bacterium]|nr:SDR family oxidoreductase [Trueperaceae bacterium]